MTVTDAVKLTAYVSDSARYEHKPLYEAILELLHREGIAGATVAHGTAGYGADKQLHTIKILRLSNDLPVIVTAIDSREKIEAVVPKLDTVIEKGLVTVEDVKIVFHRPEV
jgi:PII-like signaling protein